MCLKDYTRPNVDADQKMFNAIETSYYQLHTAIPCLVTESASKVTSLPSRGANGAITDNENPISIIKIWTKDLPMEVRKTKTLPILKSYCQSNVSVLNPSLVHCKWDSQNKCFQCYILTTLLLWKRQKKMCLTPSTKWHRLHILGKILTS